LARRDPELRHRLNQGDLNLPDGMPLIWVGRRLGLDHLEGRVYGPDLMLASMDRGRKLGLRHYLHGSTDEVLKALEAELRRRLPGVDIVGRDAPPFRELTAEEEFALEQRLVDLRPDIVWVGLGAWVRIGREANNYAKSSFHVPFSHFRWMESQTSV
jgi:N-acetylglucosaminyldiphosphoundecaprenol N-acetyl-beta-D-mannosaminyltransferase